MVNKPNLFIVGAPKCGTTSLHFYLSQHPQLSMSCPKELYYFCSDIKEIHKDVRWEDYLNHFDWDSMYSYYGETTPYYLTSPAATRDIFSMNPNAKIIISIRKPVDLLRSIHDQLVFSGKEKFPDLKEALENEKKIDKSKLSESQLHFFDYKCYRNLPKYSKHIKRYLDVFGADNVLILLFDDIKKSPQMTLDKIYNFLNVDSFKEVDFTIKNQAMLNRSKRLKELVLQPPAPLKAMLRIFLPSSKYRSRLYRFINKLNAKPKPGKGIIDANLEKELLGLFKSEVLELEKLTKKDLSHWNVS